MARTDKLEPLEAEKAGYRKPKRPIRSRFSQSQFAVVMLAWLPAKWGDDFDLPADRDYEPFKTLQKAQDYFDANVLWAKEDWATHHDMQHMIILVDNTTPDQLNFAKVEIIGGKAAWRVAVREGYKSDPDVIFAKSKRERIEGDHKVNKKVPGKRVAAPVKKVEPKKPVERKVRKPVRNTAAPIRQDVIKPRIKKKEQS